MLVLACSTITKPGEVTTCDWCNDVFRYVHAVVPVSVPFGAAENTIGTEWKWPAMHNDAT